MLPVVLPAVLPATFTSCVSQSSCVTSHTRQLCYQPHSPAVLPATLTSCVTSHTHQLCYQPHSPAVLPATLTSCVTSHTHQLCLAEQLAAAHQVSDRHVEVSDSAAPVGDLCELVHRQNVLPHNTSRPP